MGVLLQQDGIKPLLSQDSTQLLDQAAALALPAAFFPVQVTVEILINGTFVDVSQYVYQRNDIVITGGQPDEGSQSQPAQATLTLDNRTGNFSPNNAAGAFYPFLLRNTQLRISATATSVTGVYYSGYRFWGEVSTWPPASDPTATDVYVDITASGPLRRINQGGGKGSALTRYYALQTGQLAPVAYWPCEEDPSNSGIIGAGIDGGTNMTVTTGTPTWKAISDFNGSSPVGVLNNSTWDGLTGSFGASGDDIFLVPGTYQWQASTTTVNAKVWAASGGGGWGSGGANGFAGAGGGEFAQEATLAVTPGSFYTVVVGQGGRGGSAGGASQDGGNSSFQGDSVLVLAHGGKRGANITPGAGGTGSTNAVHHDGGAGGTGTAGSLGGGGGGGSSAGTGANGNPGANGSGSLGGAGGAAPAGGAAGGKGGNAIPVSQANGTPGTAPGGAGGGSAANGLTGGSGASGKAELVYTPPAAPPVNVIRWIMLVPKHGGNPGKVLVRALTGGTIARLDCLYIAGGGIQLKGYNNVASLLFTSSTLHIGDGQTVMISMEMVNSGSAVAYTLSAVIPGASALLGTVTGTQASASVGNVSEVLAGPNGDISKTAIGHISVQYALQALTRVSQALNGHSSEMSIDRFIRLANEQALANNPQFSETADHWGFELQNYCDAWTPANASRQRSAAWSSDGQSSMLLTATGEGQPSCTSPSGTSGQAVNAGDIVSVAAELFAPSGPGISNAYIGIKWYQSNGSPCAHAEDDSADSAILASTQATFSMKATAPATAATFALTFGDHHADTTGTQLYCDNFRVSPRMGVQTRKEYREFLQEIRRLDQGLLKELKTNWGLGYRTRISLINQNPGVTLDYSQAHLTGELKPVVDDLLIRNHVVVKRSRGSTITVTQNTGTMSVSEPPAGAGRYKGHGINPGGPMIGVADFVAENDAQLAALAAHLLTLGTVQDERYPVVSVNLARTAVANIFPALAGLEIGDYLKIINLPFWYPQATVKQLVIGYTERLSAFKWEIDFNCQPESPWEILVSSAPRRW